MIASRTLHCLSSASCTIAGRRDWESRSIPMTDNVNNASFYGVLRELYTLVDEFEFRDDM